MSKTLGVGIVFGALGVCAMAIAQGAPDQAAVAAGEKTFLKNCAPCHGENLTPLPGVFDLKSLLVPELTRFRRSVIIGVAPEMPAWGEILTPDEINQIWTFIRFKVDT